MDEFNANATSDHVNAVSVDAQVSKEHAAYIGLDVHKDTIAIAVAEPGREQPVDEGEIAKTANRTERKAS